MSMKIGISLAALIVVAAGAAFVYHERRAAFDTPQRQMAESAALALERSAALMDLIPQGRVEIGSSPEAFLNLYDTEGGVIVGNGYLDGALLGVPKGVFDEAKRRGEYRVTLEPRKGLRIAAVIVPFVGREANGFALAGRAINGMLY